jgi:V8-like Glu-specific endopeptidase
VDDSEEIWNDARGGASEDPGHTEQVRVDKAGEQVSRDMAVSIALERKEAYVRHGIEPAVPPELSPCPHDPAFEFVGYANEATPAEALEARENASKPTRASEPQLGDRSKPLAERETVGYLINSVGEIWRWKVTPELVARVEARKTSNGVSVDAVHGTGKNLSGDETAITTTSAIIGSDNRQIRSAHVGNNMTGYPWRTIGALNDDGTDPMAPDAECSASKIGERHLVTAGHCVWTGGEGGSVMYRDWWPGQDGANEYWEGGDPSPNAIRSIYWYWIAPGWYENGAATEDYAVLVLYDSQGVCNLGSLGYRVDLSLAGTNVWMMGYPAWGNTCTNSDHPNKSCMNSMWGMEENITRTEAEYIFYKNDQQEGQSGAPVYDYNGGNRQLVGIVKGEYTSVENRGIKITSGVYNDIQAVTSAYPSAYCSY